MADLDNFSEIKENFDTVKTLLNSIRAQGILNTSDVDKLLTGINEKLEKINTEEDIDLIKIFLSELKQNLDERHSILISKFGAIESLFTNLLKNSSEMLKSSEVKELFDIVATNLSVFSREVVSQKETLTDITLRIDALRSDDSQKKEIIKNISLLKNDLERLNNGFDSIVLSLNDNFKTIIKTITSIDKTDYLDKFSDVLSNIEMSSNTVLSALQMLDQKTGQVEDALKNLATQADIAAQKERLFDLTAQTRELTASVNDLSDKYIRIDNLAEKIDASVNIIANLKATIGEENDNNTQTVISELNKLEQAIAGIDTNDKFEEFKVSLESVLKSIVESTNLLDKNLNLSSSEIQKLSDTIKSLDINISFQNILANIGKTELNLKSHMDESTEKLSSLNEVNITRVLNSISSGAEALTSKLNDTQSSLAGLCEKSFDTVFENISDLKSTVAQLDENSVSANNAIFSNITDRLTLFENSMRSSLEKQEQSVSNTSAQLVDQIENIKNLAGVLDYKMDSSVVESGNVKREFGELKSAVEKVLALDFVTTVKDLRVDLYASKQELANTIETSSSELSEKFTNDLYGKYELLISKLDNVEDEFKKAQISSLNGIKPLLEKISSSIMDVISYVSEQKTSASSIDTDINLTGNISNLLNENSLSYVESVRDIVDVIRVQVENNLKSIQEESSAELDLVKRSISENSEDLRKEIKYTYSKLLEIQDSYNEIKEILSVNSVSSDNKISAILDKTDDIKGDFEAKLTALKNSLLDKISDYKKEFTCENADKLSELKFAFENSQTQKTQEITDLVEEIKAHLANLSEENSSSMTGALAKILENFVALKSLMNTLNDKYSESLSQKVDVILQDFAGLKSILDKVDENVDGDMTRQLSIIESNFESLVSQITILFDKSDKSLSEKIDEQFSSVSERMQVAVSEKLEEYKAKIEETFDNLQQKALSQSDYLKERISDINTAMKSVWEEQSDENMKQIEEISDKLKTVIDENIKLTAADYCSLKAKLNEFAKNIETNNQVLTQDLKAQLDDITKYIDSVLDIQAQDIAAKYDELSVKLDSIENKNEAELGTISTNITTLAEANKSGVINVINSINEVKSESETNIKSVNNVISGLFSEVKNLLSTSFAKASEDTAQLQADAADIKTDLENGINTVNYTVTDGFDSLNQNLITYSVATDKKVAKMESVLADIKDDVDAKSANLTSSIVSGFAAVDDELRTLGESLETNSTNVASQIATVNSILTEQSDAVKSSQNDLSILKEASVNTNVQLENLSNDLRERQEENSLQNQNILDAVKIVEDKASEQIEAANSAKSELSALTTLVDNNKTLILELGDSLAEKVNSLISTSAEISAGELQSIDAYVNNLSEQIDAEKKNVIACKDLIIEFLQKQLDSLSQNVEKETDAIIGELIDQFDLLKKSQSDETVKLTAQIEELVSGHIYDSIEDLKSFFDIKTDTSVMLGKLDNLKIELSDSVDKLIKNLNTLLDANLFTSSMSDYKVAVELLINSAVEGLNDRIEDFINTNIAEIGNLISDDRKNIEDKLALFDKKFIDTVVDKYEEIKLIANKYNDSFADINTSVNDIISRFEDTKSEVNDRINNLAETIKSAADTNGRQIDKLQESFDSLRSQISNKSFDEAFQASINKQIAGLEELIQEEMGYIQDISDLCCNSLPDVTEMNTLVKHSILKSIEDFSQKLDSQDIEGKLESELKEFKSDIITQFLNVFNQVSFVTEQEEILDFIQEKHSELITILSHIVTSADAVEEINDNVAVIDNKIDSLKDDIEHINEKINSIISSDGDVDYIYSLQDLESDIANLRLVLNEMKENDHGKEFNDLISSTNEIYKLVESVKSEIPSKKDVESIAEDLVSISTRTNKLILASDESYKTLQDNLQDFKLVINDLDERTRNFPREAGIDKIDSKLNSINNMMINGAKTNQVFNQVFEYLAEWVDNASVQINAISDKVETLDEIEQIKTMLTDLKATAEDDSGSVELVEALGNVFEKQTKRISSLEAKLDKIIVETTINNKNDKLDLTPLEDTINRFLVAVDEKMTTQQAKINSLEAKLEGALELLDSKDTAQLTKKVGGMDRQIAKLNKSIEKIASHVVEK